MMRSPHSDVHRVGLVVDTEFGSSIFALAARMHVWVIDSPTNRVDAETIWSRKSADAAKHLEVGVTLFQSPMGTPPDIVVGDILDTIMDHHSEWAHDPPMAELDIYGVPDTDSAAATLSSLGLVVIEREASRIRCRIPME